MTDSRTCPICGSHFAPGMGHACARSAPPTDVLPRMPTNVSPAKRAFSLEDIDTAIAIVSGAASRRGDALSEELLRLPDVAHRRLSSLESENASLKAIAADLHWMARRYADGRQSYATSLHNDNTRKLLSMNVALNSTGDGTLWARDSGGRAFDGLTDEEAAQGRNPDWRHDDKERRIEEQAALLVEAAAQFRFYERQHLAKSPPDQAKAATNWEWADKLEAGVRIGTMAQR